MGLGLTALGAAVDPQAGDMLFLGSAGAWGAWYGALTPIALELEGDFDDFLLTTTVTGDVFLALGGLALLPPLDLEPTRTLLPQLFGVGGATLGAMGVALFSLEQNEVAMGAVIGSTVGLAGGGITAAVLGPRDRASLVPAGRLPALARLPGHWSPTLTPTVIDDDPGIYAGLSVTGL